MSESWSIERARSESIASAGAGFPFLLCFGCTWIAAAAASFALAPSVAAWVYLLQGFVAMPIAILLQRPLGYPKASPDNPLDPLALQLVFVQPVAFPALVIVLSLAPEYAPAAFASVVGAHFLPFGWMYRTRIYVVLGIVLSAGAYLLAIALGRRSLHAMGFFVGACLLAGALRVRAHARSSDGAR
jgi:hypothetical protein